MRRIVAVVGILHTKQITLEVEDYDQGEQIAAQLKERLTDRTSGEWQLQKFTQQEASITLAEVANDGVPWAQDGGAVISA